MPVLSPRRFHDIVSGRDRTIVGSCWRLLFAALQPIYRWIITRRNREFDAGRREVNSVPAIVVSVGNLTVGGTGKTPLVRWLCEFYRRRGHDVAIVSRGYGAKPGQLNDEARELAIYLPDVPHEQARQRIDAARRVLETFEAARQAPSDLAPVIILDDALQHRQMGRSLDIVMLDATCPFGYERLLPAGLLREPLESLKRAQIIALSRATSIDAAERLKIKQRALSYNPMATWVELSHEPRTLIDCDRNEEPLGDLSGKRIFAFCGIGNPPAFRKTLESLGPALTGFEVFPDHAEYDQLLLAQLERSIQAQSQIPELVLCTLKDLVKIPQRSLANIPLRALSIDLVFCDGQASMEYQLASAEPLSTTTAS